MKRFNRYLQRAGLLLGAIALEVDKIDAVPEAQRGWYALDTSSGKYKLDASKVDIEDTAGLKTALQKEREQNRLAKIANEKAVADALKPFEGIDPEETRRLLSQFASEDEKRLIQAGHIDQVIAARMQKREEEFNKNAETAAQERDGALEVASTFMERVLDNHVREACAKAGVHPSAVEDALLRARNIFSLDDEGAAVQFGEDGETVVLGKDGKAPFSPAEWLEGMKEKAPHWFPSGAGGGGAPGSRKAVSGQDLSGLSPTARMTAARAAQQQGRK